MGRGSSSLLYTQAQSAKNDVPPDDSFTATNKIWSKFFNLSGNNAKTNEGFHALHFQCSGLFRDARCQTQAKLPHLKGKSMDTKLSYKLKFALDVLFVAAWA